MGCPQSLQISDRCSPNIVGAIDEPSITAGIEVWGRQPERIGITEKTAAKMKRYFIGVGQNIFTQQADPILAWMLATISRKSDRQIVAALPASTNLS